MEQTIRKQEEIEKIYEYLVNTFGKTTIETTFIRSGKEVTVKKKAFIKNREGVFSSLYSISEFVVKFLNKELNIQNKELWDNLINKIISKKATYEDVLHLRELCRIKKNNNKRNRSLKDNKHLSKNENKKGSVMKDKNYFESEFIKVSEEMRVIHGWEGVIEILDVCVKKAQEQRQYHLDQIYGKGL